MSFQLTSALTTEILTRIVSDAAANSPSVIAVGLVGSFARNEQKSNSDVDLLVKTDGTQSFSQSIEQFGAYVHHVLDYQFNRRVDVVRYDMAVDRAARRPNEGETWFFHEGFVQMLEEVRWIYEKR